MINSHYAPSPPSSFAVAIFDFDCVNSTVSSNWFHFFIIYEFYVCFVLRELTYR